MPFDGNSWEDKKLVPFYEMMDIVQAAYPGLERLAQDHTDTSKDFRVAGHKGTVGFITSMTNNFCGACNRLRITADGNLKVCLFGQSEVSLRDAIRSGSGGPELSAIIQAAVHRKKARHAGMYKIAAMQNRPMVKIGG